MGRPRQGPAARSTAPAARRVCSRLCRDTHRHHCAVRKIHYPLRTNRTTHHPQMKALRNIITLAAFIALPLTAMTAEPEKQPDTKIHKVVFEVAIDGVEQWLGALRNVENVQKALGVDCMRIEVVSHGKPSAQSLALRPCE